MALVVNHNIPALQTYNAVNATTSSLQKSIQKLSTGLRINSAADDAAGLAISEKMRAQVRGLDRAVANSQDGISMIQTAEGALSETHSILQRMRELSVQAANDTLTQQDRAFIQLEIDQLREEVTRIGNTTQFNKKKLLDGSAAVLWSSDNLTTKALVKGGLRTIDQFGQKVAAEGNYKIDIKATPGQGEVKKTDELKIKHKSSDVSSTSIDRQVPEKLNEPVLNYIPVTAATAGTAATMGTFATKGGTTTGGATTVTAQTGTNQMQEIYLELGAFTTSAADITTGGTLTGWYTKTDGTHGTISGTLTAAVGNLTQTIAATFTEAGTGSTSTGSFTFVLTGGATGLTVATTTNLHGDTTTGTTIDTDDIQVTVGTTTYVLDGASVANKKLTLHDYKGTTPDLEFTMPALDVITYTANGSLSLPVIKGVNKVPGGTNSYSAESVEAKGTALTVTDIYRASSIDSRATDALIKSLLDTGAFTKGSAALTFTVSGTSDDGDLTLTATGTYWALDGTETAVTGSLAWADGAVTTATLAVGAGGNLTAVVPPNTADLAMFGNGDKFSVFFSNANGANVGVEVTGTDGTKVVYNFDTTSIKGAGMDLTRYGYDAAGASSEFGVKVKVPTDFVLSKIGDIASLNTKLRDIDKFWNSEGRFLLEDAQTLTLTQSDGTQTKVTLYGDDTVQDMMNKLNSAVAVGLGQSKYVGVTAADKFVTYVTKSDAEGNAADVADGESAETAPGTFVIRSVIAGADGKISFAGDEDLIKALSMNVLKEARESSYQISITDAHTGMNVATGRITGNKLIGMVHENVDVVFDAMTGITANFNEKTGYFNYNETTIKSTILHLADNTTVFQIGANEGEDMGVNFGDMRAEALGLTKVLVTDRESAARSVTIIDNAIDKVSTQRSKLGAYQNRLEHTINNLTIAGENLTAAESRIRDTDMAKEMMNFTKLQIMLQAGTSMLAQANTLPQNVLSLLR
jgi:flagellin